MTSRLALIPGYQAAERKVHDARIALNQAVDARQHAADRLSAATKAEAADQIGRIFTWSTGRRAKIVEIGAHYHNRALAYPIIAYELGKRGTWAKKETHWYSHIFNFELREWEYGTVDSMTGEFKLTATKTPILVAEKADA